MRRAKPKGSAVELSPKIILARALEIIVGGLFIYAGLQKVQHPYEFAEAILAYQLLPVSAVGLFAAVISWVEVSAGFFLAVGLKRRSCLLILSTLLTGFLVAILITLARGLEINCGCGLFFQRQIGPAIILEDLFLLVMSLGLYWWELVNNGHGFLSLVPKTEN